MSSKIWVSAAAAVMVVAANGQQGAPNVSQVLMYSATVPSLTVPNLNGSSSITLVRAVPSIFTETVAQTPGTDTSVVSVASNYTVSRDIVQLNNALNASIATALSIIPLSSPASGVISKNDPVTGAELLVNSTLGPIFTERAETLGKGRFYIGFSNQDFHFTKFNGTSLNSLSVLYQGGQQSKIVLPTGAFASTAAATFSIGMDVRLSQNIAFLTYGATSNLDISVGLPVIHSSVSARTFNGTIYAGNGFGAGQPWWCANTFTPGYPTLTQPQIGQTALGKTGLGDVLVRLKGSVVHKPHLVVAVGGDVRLPTGDEQNYLGVGTTTFKPFAAVSFYSRPMHKDFVISPHFDVGWQFSGKSVLGGELQGTPLTQSTSAGTVNYIGAPFVSTRDNLPDVFTWAAGAEIAAGRHHTFIVDLLGNQVGWIHGIPNATTQTISNVLLPTGPNGDSTNTAVPQKGTASGLVSVGRVSFGQYTASLGYKARITGNLVANFNILLRLDDNGLAARTVPMFGVGYSF